MVVHDTAGDVEMLLMPEEEPRRLLEIVKPRWVDPIHIHAITLPTRIRRRRVQSREKARIKLTFGATVLEPLACDRVSVPRPIGHDEGVQMLQIDILACWVGRHPFLEERHKFIGQALFAQQRHIRCSQLAILRLASFDVTIQLLP